MQLIFGIGALWGTRSDVTGVGPDQFAILQENSIDFSFEVKELYSTLQFPVDIARGKGKITGKAKMARVFGTLYADMFFGTTTAVGQTAVAQNEAGTIPAATPFTITVANSTHFVADLGVYAATGNATGQRFSQATTPTLTRTYSVNTATGVYTFASVDANLGVQISYVYTDATQGKTLQITNNLMGYTPTFIGTFYQERNTQGGTGKLTLRLNECVSSHLTFPSRLDDYGIPDFDWMAFADQANNIGILSTSE